MSKYKTKAELLQIFRIRLENTQRQPIITENMAKYGYDAEKLKEGWDLLGVLENAYNLKKQEDLEKNEANTKFKTQRKAIDKVYNRHRKIAKTLFEKEPDTLLKLSIKGKVPDAYAEWFETTNTFYTASLADKDVQNTLATRTITSEELEQQKAALEQLQHDRADYVRERGESQDATSKTEKAFDAVEKWMSEFKAVAKIALADHLQLLEALRIKA